MQLNQVLEWFESTPAWKRLSPNSQNVYRILIRQGIESLGPDRDVNTIKAGDADKLYDQLESVKGMHKAVSVCTVLRRVWGVLKRYNHTSFNPFSHMGLSVQTSRKVLWTEEQINTFIRASVEYGLPSLGLLLILCYTFAQRPGDMRKLKWENYDGEYLTFTQEKTGKEMVLYVPEDVRDDLSLVEQVGPFIVTREDTGLPYTDDDYLYHYKNILSIAGLPKELQLRDTRKTAINEVIERGGTDSDLMNIGGHNVRTTLNKYQVTTKKSAKRVASLRFRS